MKGFVRRGGRVPQRGPFGGRMHTNMFFVYIIKSVKTGKFYTGVTEDLVKRLENHNKGGTKSSKPFRPWKIVYKESFIDKNEAYRREFYLKSPKGYLEKKSILSKLI
ncbi:MAG: GIY-YIG nuclease family protein [Patescibacteria group bacterium]